MNTSVPENYALLPLTVFDKMFERTTFITGWLVEGKIDASAFTSALDTVTKKWRMLSGRLQSVKEGEDVKWYIKIPLGPIPPDYPTYALTTSVSPVPLSEYVSIPIPPVSASLPQSVFLHASTPRQCIAWEKTDHPLTCWNVVYFPASANNGVDYTCIGFARSHGIFDGGGAAQIMNALVAEMRKREWTPPSPPHAGLNLNPVEEAVIREAQAKRFSLENYDGPIGYIPIPIGGAGLTKLIEWHIGERQVRGAARRVALLPKAVLTDLVESAKSALLAEGGQVHHITTGDILAAWIFKTAYSGSSDSTMMIHCTNFASFRDLLKHTVKSVTAFPHNAFIPLPYPVLSVGDVKSFSLSALTSLFAASRLSLTIDHVIAAHHLLQKPCFPSPPGAQETMTISNVSASRILEADWTAVRSKRTLCGYRYQASPTDFLFTNAVYIAGRLGDGSVVLDSTLNKARFDLLSGEIQRSTAKLEKKSL
ncbi:hypothetical protein HYPSUDRAFT_55353 [Hypholoma sublateritium FD-334 SS-4]|uniref:Uncharacterized protein n=1 Tax=Hypholoma sublateritium (strain FD-334 SS-4) TaxID=945553 RepID=A0A0D2NS58_HYPSF|nr:hypothetical protein HYPSUDRAFT_55353 [Hypholoma sublateritium FD-334 SS-4]